MKIFNNLLILLFLTVLSAPTFAAVGDVETTFCNVFSDSDKKESKGKEEEEEEPDCE
jgi:hypothetical protein